MIPLAINFILIPIAAIWALKDAAVPTRSRDKNKFYRWLTISNILVYLPQAINIPVMAILIHQTTGSGFLSGLPIAIEYFVSSIAALAFVDVVNNNSRKAVLTVSILALFPSMAIPVFFEGMIPYTIYGITQGLCFGVFFLSKILIITEKSTDFYENHGHQEDNVETLHTILGAGSFAAVFLGASIGYLLLDHFTPTEIFRISLLLQFLLLAPYAVFFGRISRDPLFSSMGLPNKGFRLRDLPASAARELKKITTTIFAMRKTKPKPFAIIATIAVFVFASSLMIGGFIYNVIPNDLTLLGFSGMESSAIKALYFVVLTVSAAAVGRFWYGARVKGSLTVLNQFTVACVLLVGFYFLIPNESKAYLMVAMLGILALLNNSTLAVKKALMVAFNDMDLSSASALALWFMLIAAGRSVGPVALGTILL